MRAALFVVFLAYIVLLVIRPHEFMPSLQHVPILQYTLVTAMLLWLATPDKGLASPQFPLAVALLVSAWIGMGLSGWWGGILKILDILLPPLCVFIAASGAVRSRRQLRIFMWVLAACAAVVVLHGRWQLRDGIGWTGSLPIQGRITYSGIFNDPNDIGLLLVVCIASVIYLVGSTPARLPRLLLLAALGWLLYGVYLTDSRGTLLATLVVLGFYAWRRFGRIALVALAAMAIPAVIATTRLAEVSTEEASAEGRLDAWYEGLQMLRHNPFFGVGFSNFNDYFYLTAHNSLVLAMAELGFVGYTIWLAFVGYSAVMLYRLAFPGGVADAGAKPPDAGPEIAANRALFAAGLGFAIGAFFLSQSYKFLLFLLCGLAVGRFVALSAEAGGTLTSRIGADPVKWPVLAMISIVAFWLGLKLLL
jgi:O-antigen ligase